MLANRLHRTLLTITIAFTATALLAQDPVEITDYRSRDDFNIAGITISGIRFLDQNALIGLSGLRIGQRVDIPGDDITSAVKKLYAQGLFSDVRITETRREGDNVYLDIYLQERPRLSTIKLTGIRNSESQDLLEKIAIPNGSQVTSHSLNNAKNRIKGHFIEKGFLNTEVTIVEKDDPDSQNMVILNIHIDKKDKVKIEEIIFVGAENFNDKRLRRVMKDTKQRDLNFFKASRFISKKFEDDKTKLTAFYNEHGYREIGRAHV